MYTSVKTIIALHNLSLTYGEEVILDGWSCEIGKGENLVFKGASGSGKTSLLRMIMGFEQPDAGQIIYQDKTVSPEIVADLRKQVAWLPQNAAVGTGTVEEVIRFPFGFQQNKPSAPSDKEIIQVIELLGLAPPVLDKSIDRLSGGERQRIGLALCYLLDKPILLLDEPTASLDHGAKEQVRNLILGLDNRTIISTSHDETWISWCDRTVELT